MNNAYEKIVTDIINQILIGDLRPGDKLDTEGIFISRYGVSKMTVRKAFEKLKSLDIIETVERRGSFIKKKELNSSNSTDFVLGYSLTAILKKLVPSSEILEFNIIKPNYEIAKQLNITLDTDIYFIKRLRYLNGVPSAIEISYIPTFELPNLKINHAENSIYKKLYEEKGVLITNISANIEAIIPTQDLIGKLQLQEGEAVFLITQLSKISEFNNFEYVKSFHAGSRINI